jgi:hypothetical protein
MRNFDLLNVYKQKKFTVYSAIRNKQFRFIRYTGDNYEEIKSYINEISPNTSIWKEETLKVGVLYGYSGRTSQFLSVWEQNIRTVIASNPYLIDDLGEPISLALNNEEATEYLKIKKTNRVFCYEDMLASFYYDPKEKLFFAVDKNHPKGISFSSLPDNREWYIGTRDNIHSVHYTINVRYQHTLHIVDFKIAFEGLVEEIEKLKYDINELLYKKNNSCMFKASWENYIRRKTLSTICLNEYLFEDFISVVYKTLYEETKNVKGTRATLGSFANDKFVEIVGELRHHYAHGNSEYIQSKSIPISQIYLKYLKIEIGPQCPEDFVSMQSGIIDDLIIFLKQIYDYTLNSSAIIDTINEDYYDNLYCGKVALPKHFSIYKGLVCRIKIYKANENADTQQYFPYYSSNVDYIETKYEGTIEINEKGEFCCQDYKITNQSYHKEGRRLLITKIRPYGDLFDDTNLRGVVIECSFVDSTPTQTEPQPTEKIGVKYIVKVDASGYTHVGSTLIGKKKYCRQGDVIIIKEIGKNPTPNAEFVKKYPFVAKEIDIVSKDANVSREIDGNDNKVLPSYVSDMIGNEYVVEIDENGLSHIREVSVNPKFCKEGNTVKLQSITRNTNPKISKIYPYFADRIEIIK